MQKVLLVFIENDSQLHIRCIGNDLRATTFRSTYQQLSTLCFQFYFIYHIFLSIFRTEIMNAVVTCGCGSALDVIIYLFMIMGIQYWLILDNSVGLRLGSPGKLNKGFPPKSSIRVVSRCRFSMETSPATFNQHFGFIFLVCIFSRFIFITVVYRNLIDNEH